MPNTFFQFKQFTVHQDKSAMKVTTDGCLFGAWIASLVEEEHYHSLLDIGTGTGLLSLMIAQKTTAAIDAIEIDHETSDQAVQNTNGSPFNDKIKIIYGDANSFPFKKRYDIIVSNPPFYEKELKGEDVKKNTAHHDTGLLLPGLLDLIRRQLNPDGRFFLLLPYKRKEEIKRLLLQKEFYTKQVLLVKQTTHHDYFRILLEGRLNGHEPTIINRMAIKDGDEYTNEFRKLLKDYYLHL